MKRYNSPVNSSRSVSNKPPTGRLQSNTRDSYETHKKLSPIQDKNSYSSKKSSKKSDDEDDNDSYKGTLNKGKNSSKFNSDSNDENFDKKRFGSSSSKSKSKYDDEEEENDFKSKYNNKAKFEDSDEEQSKKVTKSSYSYDFGEKKSYNNSNRYDEFDIDNYKNKNKQLGNDFPPLNNNKKLTDSLKLEQEMNKEYEKLYNTNPYDKFDDHRRTTQDKLGLQSNKTAIPLPAPPNRANSLDRVGMNTNSAYNNSNALTSNRNKYSSSNNLNYLETMSDKSTSSLNGTNLSVREAKSRYIRKKKIF